MLSNALADLTAEEVAEEARKRALNKSNMKHIWQDDSENKRE